MWSTQQAVVARGLLPGTGGRLGALEGRALGEVFGERGEGVVRVRTVFLVTARMVFLVTATVS